MLALARGAAAAREEASLLWWEPGALSRPERSAVGKGKVFVTSRRPSLSMPTREPVAAVGKLAEQCLTIFMTTCDGGSFVRLFLSDLRLSEYVNIPGPQLGLP